MTGVDSTSSVTGWRTAALVIMALAGIASLVALVLTLGSANRQRDEALEAQRHSYDVMILARTLSGTIARAEASLGRYTISGDQELGQLFSDGWAAAGGQLDRLDRITSSGQQRRVDALRQAYNRRAEELNLIALSTRYGKNAQAIALFYRDRRAPSLLAIDRELDALGIEERQLLDQRTTAAMHSVDRSSRIAGALAGFGALLVLGAAVLGWITVRSLAEARVAEAEADAARDRAAELARAVAQATEELRVQEARLRQVQKMEAIGQLTGGIAHDFNNMLAVVTGGLELAGRSLASDPAAARRHIEAAAEGTERAATLTRRLLAFSREESLKPQTLHLGQLVAGMRDLLDRALGDGITVILADSSGNWCVRGDKLQLENAILNLAVNARDAMSGRGDLTITTAQAAGATPEEERVTLAVTDSGYGMTPEVAERVFEPFFTTKDVGKGTGLGLYQIFAMVGQLGGDVDVETAPGVGTTVTLRLRRDVTGVMAEPRPIMTPLAGSATRALDILVVEDDPRVLTATLEALIELGHRPVACDDPLAAPALLDTLASVDLIVSDVLMPRRTGPEMIAALDAHWRDLPVLFLTGYAGEVNAAEFGGHGVLRKPFTLAALEAAVADAAGDRAAPPIAA